MGNKIPSTDQTLDVIRCLYMPIGISKSSVLYFLHIKCYIFYILLNSIYQFSITLNLIHHKLSFQSILYVYIVSTCMQDIIINFDQ